MRRAQQLLPLNTGPEIFEGDLREHDHSTVANPLHTKLPQELVTLVNSNLTLRALATDDVIAQFEIELMQQIGVWDSLKAILEKKESERTQEDLMDFVRVLGSRTHKQEVDHSFTFREIACRVKAALSVDVDLDNGIAHTLSANTDINSILSITVTIGSITVSIANMEAGMRHMEIIAVPDRNSVFVDSPHFAIKQNLPTETYIKFTNDRADVPANGSLQLRFSE